MTDAVEVAIAGALLARAVAFAAAQSPALPLALPNIAFTPPDVGANAQWLRASLLPADTLALGINASAKNQHYGLLQIDVFYGLGGGEIAPTRIAAAIIAYFARFTTMTRDGFVVQVTQPPYRTTLIVDEPWVQVQVRIPYLCFAPDPS